MKKENKKKFRDIRNALVMMCVMVAMLSTASYAWFTMTSSPTVTGMQMTAASSGGGLEVSNDNTVYKGAITVTDSSDTKVLKPVTLTEGSETNLFKGPVYTGEKVTGFVNISDEDAVKGYVAKYEYYLKETTTDASSGEQVSIGIICGDSTTAAEYGLDSSDGPKLPGSFVRQSYQKASDDKSTINPSYAVRVGLVVKKASDGSNVTLANNKKIIVWEPNADGTNDGVSATMALVDGAYVNESGYLALQSNKDGSIKNDVVTGGSGNTSKELFKMDKGSAVKITMYVWLQGSDDQCANEIQTGHLQSQIQFTIVEDTNP